MDQEWAAAQLEDFLDALRSLDKLERLLRLPIEGSERVRLLNDIDDADHTVRRREPAAQIIMVSGSRTRL